MVSSREALRRLREDGWSVVRTTGSHHHLRHPTKVGMVTVPHPKKDLPINTERSIERQSGVKMKD